MQFRRRCPGGGSTDFYFTDFIKGGMSDDQQMYIADDRLKRVLYRICVALAQRIFLCHAV